MPERAVLPTGKITLPYYIYHSTVSYMTYFPRVREAQFWNISTDDFRFVDSLFISVLKFCWKAYMKANIESFYWICHNLINKFTTTFWVWQCGMFISLNCIILKYFKQLSDLCYKHWDNSVWPAMAHISIVRETFQIWDHKLRLHKFFKT